MQFAPGRVSQGKLVLRERSDKKQFSDLNEFFIQGSVDVAWRIIAPPGARLGEGACW